MCEWREIEACQSVVTVSVNDDTKNHLYMYLHDALFNATPTDLAALVLPLVVRDAQAAEHPHAVAAVQKQDGPVCA